MGGRILQYGTYDHVLTNFYCEGCERFNFDDLGKVDFRNCCLICDETGISADSRNFKQFSEDAKFFFQQQNRKSGSVFIWTSQSYDSVDKRIRDLTDQYFYIRPCRLLPSVMSTVIPIDPAFDIVQGKPSTYYDFAPIHQHGHIYLPKHWNRIDTSEYIITKELAEPKFKKW